ncbi:hypothetical protein ACFWH1_18515 [Streptomyces sp. NPDC127037]|uniref:hypothetical protein n=1 Tax=Streptomyces sp. NPDC127037 TaxID=3347113 RepID=UPI0036613304
MTTKLIPARLAAAIANEAARHHADPLREAQVLGVLAAAGYGVQDIAELAGTTRDCAELALALLDLTEPAKWALAEGVLPVALARQVGRLSEPNQHLMLNRWLRGEFKNERHAERYALAIESDEQPQVSF